MCLPFLYLGLYNVGTLDFGLAPETKYWATKNEIKLASISLREVQTLDEMFKWS